MQSENELADASVSIALTALNFQPDIERLTRDFAGREWIFADIEHWIRHSDERIFTLTGEPGIGKSAVAARLTQLRSDIAAHHFCIAGRNSTITPGTVLRSLAAQLGIKLPNYGFALANTVKPERLAVNVHIYAETMTGGQITGVVIRNLASTDAMEEFEILLRGALQALELPPEPLLILIDSLDQPATYTGEPNLIQLLAKAQDLPSWVRFIFTTRPDRRVLRYFEPLQPHSLSDESQLNRDDIRRYILNRAQQPALDTRLTAIHADRKGFADALTAFSSGNFLYARMLLDGIAQGTQSLDDLSTLPRGLGEIYHSFLTRFTPQEWEARYQPLLLVLVVALEPLNEARLQKFTGIAHTQVRQGLGVLRQFLDVGEDVQHNETFSLFHRSFRDYLTDEKANRDFWCAPADGHRAISDSYQYASGAGYEQVDDYGLRYLPIHLAGATQRAALKTLLLDFVWLRAKLAAIGVAAAIADCDLLLDDPGVRIVRDALRLAAHVLARDPTQVGTQLLGRIDPRDAKADEPMLSALLAKAAVSMDHLWLRPLRSSLAHALEPLVGTFAMHDDSVKALVITSDGKRAVSADSSGVVKVWEIESGTEVFSLRVDEREILALAVAPDGRRAFSAGWDYALTCWNLETGRSCGRRMAANQVITSVQVSANGTGVFCGSIDEHINAFAVESGEHLGWLADNQRITALAISPDGQWLLSGGDVGCTLWRIASRERIRQFNTDSSDPKPMSYAYPGLLLPMAVTADSQQVVVGSPVLSVWDIATGERLRVISPESVRALALAPDGHLAVTADKQL